jgi:hypothetical protein
MSFRPAINPPKKPQKSTIVQEVAMKVKDNEKFSEIMKIVNKYC